MNQALVKKWPLYLSTKNINEFFEDERFKGDYRREDIDKIIEEKVERQLGRIREEKLTEEFWKRKANEPPTDKCVDEAGWEEFGKKVRGEKQA